MYVRSYILLIILYVRTYACVAIGILSSAWANQRGPLSVIENITR